MSSWINYIYNSIYGIESESLPKPLERKYGWKKGEKYINHQKHLFCLSKTHNNIKSLDLRSKCPTVYDQGQLGSCTANAIGFCYHFDEIAQNEKSPFVPSRLFIYYNERSMEGHVDFDSGAEIHDGIQSICNVGVCPEEMWCYDISKFTQKPSDECYNKAKEHHSIQYRAVEQTVEQLKAALIDGFPVVFGFLVYESFESPEVARTGIMPIPKEGEQLLGGHAVSLVGFDDEKQWFVVRNSWGENWGDKGYFYMPYSFIQNPDMASDFWTVTKTVDVEEKKENPNNNMLENHLKNKIVIDKVLDNIISNPILKDNLELEDEKPSSPIYVVGKRNRRNKHKLH